VQVKGLVTGDGTRPLTRLGSRCCQEESVDAGRLEQTVSSRRRDDPASAVLFAP
jgi:hypothetical protein